MTYNCLNASSDLIRPMQPLKDAGTRHYANIFDVHQCHFHWGGSDPAMAYLFRTHIETQARNVERMLGRYVPRKAIKRSGMVGSEIEKPDSPKHDDSPNDGKRPMLTPVAAPTYGKYFHSPKGAGVIFLMTNNYFSLLIYKVRTMNIFLLSIASHIWSRSGHLYLLSPSRRTGARRSTSPLSLALTAFASSSKLFSKSPAVSSFIVATSSGRSHGTRYSPP